MDSHVHIRASSTKISTLSTSDTSETIDFQADWWTNSFLLFTTYHQWKLVMWRGRYYFQEYQHICSKANERLIRRVNANFEVTFRVLSYFKDTTNPWDQHSVCVCVCPSVRARACKRAWVYTSFQLLTQRINLHQTLCATRGATTSWFLISDTLAITTGRTALPCVAPRHMRSQDYV